MPRPTPTQLDQQAAKLRDRAAALDRVHNTETERIGAEFGEKIDAARLAAQTARAAAEAATKQADEFQDKAKEFSGIAKDLDKSAVGAPRTPGSDYDHGDNMQDNAQLIRSQVTVYTRRAEQAQKAAREQFDRADRHEREAARLERADSDARSPLHDLKMSGDDLETKAAALEEAAQDLRAASNLPPTDRQKLFDRADQSIARSEAITPVDVSRLDPRIFIDAGIPFSEVPGAELMPLPTTPPSPRASLDAPAADDVDVVAGVAPPASSPALDDVVAGVPVDTAADLPAAPGADDAVASFQAPVDDLGLPAGAADVDPGDLPPPAVAEPVDDFAAPLADDELAAPVVDDAYEYET